MEKQTIYFPEEIGIETSILCNANCIYCGTKSIKRIPVEMPFSLAKDIVMQCKYKKIRAIYPYFAGEPLLVSWLFDLLDLIGTNLKHVPVKMMYSNATLLTKDKARKLVDSCLTNITFSLDAATQKTFEKMKGIPVNYKEAVDNIIYLLKYRNKKGRGDNLWGKFVRRPLNICVNFVVTEHNKHEKEQFLDFWNKIKGIGAGITYNDGRGEHYGREEATDISIIKKCIAPWKSCNILTNGKIAFCCHDIEGELIGENIYEKSIEEIWNGEKYRRIVEEFPNNYLCNGCKIKPASSFT